MITNPLPEYLEQNGVPVRIDIEPDQEALDDPQWLKKVKNRVGSIIVEYNYLVREIDECILDTMNERAEDERVWVFLESMTSQKKTDTLSKLYDILFAHFNCPDAIKEQKKSVFSELDKLRLQRNMYVHANWHNTAQGELVEHKTKRMKNGLYGRFRRSISINDLDSDLQRICKIQDDLFELHESVQEEISK